MKTNTCLYRYDHCKRNGTKTCETCDWRPSIGEPHPSNLDETGE